MTRYRHSLVVLLLALSVFSSPVESSVNGLNVSYYNGENFDTLISTGIDVGPIAYDWGRGSPAEGVQADYFSVKWTGFLYAPVDGEYTFKTVTDDGVRLSIDGQLLINRWDAHVHMEVARKSLLKGRFYSIEFAMREHTGSAQAHLYWTPPGGSEELISSDVLFLVAVLHVSVDEVAEQQASDVNISYTLLDPEQDAVNILCEYSTDGGQAWHPSTVTGKTEEITSEEYELRVR